MQSELSLFVYGSFSEGMVHFSKISQYIVEKESAQAFGRVYRLPCGFPAFLTANDSQTTKVLGECVKLRAPDLVYKLLDEFHGVSPLVPEKSLHFKQNISVQTRDGMLREAIVYALNPAKLPKNSVHIESGDWQSLLKTEPALSQTLTERQATYIKRLNQSTGREIVPIDLSLYRELMKLELIVDKGRRLALSPLGKEVARFLPE
jgi:gamma-glutamylcyclotransferase (GGCT)/AIG2-like uncharacterized protein YtfP